MRTLEVYPLTIIKDRYNGTYSEGKYTAFKLHHCDVPSATIHSDIECADFWRDYPKPVGLGDTPDEALKDLREKLGFPYAL